MTRRLPSTLTMFGTSDKRPCRISSRRGAGEEMMPRIFAIGLGMLFLATGTASASAFRLGPEVLGTWCGDAASGLFFQSDDCKEDWVTIARDGWRTVESDCKIISGKIIGKEAAHTKALPSEYNPVYKLKMSCYAEGFTSRETFTIVAFKGTLEITPVRLGQPRKSC
jgi:hypothetical protein